MIPKKTRASRATRVEEGTPVEADGYRPPALDLATLQFREDMDGMVCSEPNCTHTAHDGLYLHQACHTLKGVYVLRQKDILRIRCSVCDHPVADVAVGALKMENDYSATCAHEAPFYAWYRNGWLDLKCSVCDKALYRFPVLSRHVGHPKAGEA